VFAHTFACARAANSGSDNQIIALDHFGEMLRKCDDTEFARAIAREK